MRGSGGPDPAGAEGAESAALRLRGGARGRRAPDSDEDSTEEEDEEDDEDFIELQSGEDESAEGRDEDVEEADAEEEVGERAASHGQASMRGGEAKAEAGDALHAFTVGQAVEVSPTPAHLNTDSVFVQH